MKRTLILAGLLAWGSTMTQGATYSNLSAPLCDEANHVIYDGKGNFMVQSGAETTVELSINLASLQSYANSNDYKSGSPLLLWDADFADYGLTDLADTTQPTGSRTPALAGYGVDKIWQPGRNINFATLQQYAGAGGTVQLKITNSNSEGVTVTARAADGSEQVLYRAPELRYSRNRKLSAYRVNLNYVTAVTLHTPSALDTAGYTPPKDYTIPFVSQREDGLSLGRVMFMGDSITHGVNDCTWRWQLFKILVDNGVEAEIVGPRSGYTPGYTKLSTRDSAMNSYGGSEFPNYHLAQSSGRTHNIISGSNAGMSGVNYGGHSTASSAATYNCDTWFCLMGTNDLLSDSGYSEAEFAAKMQRLLGGRVICRNGLYTRKGSDNQGTMARIATDVLKDSSDVLYIMSVPCWGSHHNNNAPERHLAVQQYNSLLQQWVAEYSKKSGLNLRYVDINEGMVDPTHKVPFSWPDSMSNRPGRDGLHPNEQGSLIMAGNLARALDIAGRTAGLPRAAAKDWATAKLAANERGRTISNAAGNVDSSRGYSLELPTSCSGKSPLKLTLSDGRKGGTLTVEQQRICWGGAPLYCAEKLQGELRIVWHPGKPQQNVLPGIYVWLGDMLIGQGLATAPTDTANGIHISGSNKLSPRDISLNEQPLAPATDLRTAPSHAYTIR